MESNRDYDGKYLTFSLANEEYGLGILMIKEIIGMTPIVAIPQAAVYVRGVINLRGRVIPVVDLRLKFGMEQQADTDRTCIIIVEIVVGPGALVAGIVVDSVSEVLNIKAESIEEAPAFDATMNTDFILGMAKRGDGVTILLHIDRVLRGEEFDSIKAQKAKRDALV